MRTIPSDDDFREAYRGCVPDRQAGRERLLAAIARGEHLRFQPARLTTIPKRLTVSAAAAALSLAIAVGAWLLSPRGGAQGAFAFEGLHERLLKIRSLHVTGWIYETVEVDGVPTRSRFPIEFYAERPSRSWSTWYGFSLGQVNSGYSVVDGARSLWVSHSGQQAIVGAADPVAAELRVEFDLQNHWTSRIVEGPPADYKIIGKQEVNGVMALEYESIHNGPSGKTRNVVWVNPQTGLPVRSTWYSYDDTGNLQLDQDYESIKTDVPPQPDMFTFRPPDGYARAKPDAAAKTVDQPRGAQYTMGSGGAGADQLSVRFILAIDDRAALVCWHHRKLGPDGPPRPGWVADLLQMELTAGKENRPCDSFLIREQEDGDDLWTWSLAVPRDRRPVRLPEALNVVFEGRAGRIVVGQIPLRFDDVRLQKLLASLQTAAFSKPSPDEPPFTLTDLRGQVDDVLAE